MLQQLVLLPRREEPRRESGAVNRRPEAIARPPEMTADRRGVEAGIDAAEEDVEIRRDDVRQGFAVRGGEIGFAGLQKFSANPPRYFFERPCGVSVSMRYGEFSARASSTPISSFRSTGR